MKKSKRIMLITSLMCTLIFGISAMALSAQQVKVPYVVSSDSWWTGIAITNNSDEAITDMTLYYTTKDGVQGEFVPIKSRGLVLEPTQPIIKKIFAPYKTTLPTISGHAMLLNTLNGLYKGDSNKTLPLSPGSIILKNNGDQKFSVTVYIGSGEGFAFQTFESTNP